MARGNPGKIVMWIDKAGAPKYGIAYDKEQTPNLTNKKNMLVRYVSPDFTTMEKDANGRHVGGLVAIDILKVIGFVD